MLYICKVKVIYNEDEYGYDYTWEELSGVYHTTEEAAIKERYEFQLKEVEDGEYVHEVRIEEVSY